MFAFGVASHFAPDCCAKWLPTQTFRSSTLPDASFKELMLHPHFLVEAKLHRLLWRKVTFWWVDMSRQLRVFQKFNITLNWVYDGGLVKLRMFLFCFVFQPLQKQTTEGTKEPWGGKLFYWLNWTVWHCRGNTLPWHVTRLLNEHWTCS